MATIEDLPIELLILIFLTLYRSSRDPGAIDDPNRRSGGETPGAILAIRHIPTLATQLNGWIEKDLHAPNIFPYSVASVCRLWRDILVKYSAFWTRVIFDNASNPPLPVDVFLWSKTRLIEVLVFDPPDNSRPLSPVRAAAIGGALALHIHRCTTVAFEVGNASLLPPLSLILGPSVQNSHLTSLVLEARVDDYFEMLATTLSIPVIDYPLQTMLPHLKHLSLPGQVFMDIGRNQPGWMRGLRPARRLCLVISNFQFDSPGAYKEGGYTFNEFVNHLDQLQYCNHLIFRRLGLSYQPEQVRGHEKRPLHMTRFGFEEVDAGFLGLFFGRGFVSDCEKVMITRCEIPPLPPFHSNELKLKGIAGELSLYHILDCWSGREVDFDSCPAFDDRLLRWLNQGERERRPILTNNLITMSLKDCSNFTPASLRKLIGTRNDNSALASGGWREPKRVRYVGVYGKVPLLTQRDVSRFNTMARRDKASAVTFGWKVANPDGTWTKYPIEESSSSEASTIGDQ